LGEQPQERGIKKNFEGLSRKQVGVGTVRERERKREQRL